MQRRSMKQSIVTDKLKRSLQETSDWFSRTKDRVMGNVELSKEMKEETTDIAGKIKSAQQDLERKQKFAKKKQDEVVRLTTDIARLTRQIQKINEKLTSTGNELMKELDSAKKLLTAEQEKYQTLKNEIESELGIKIAKQMTEPANQELDNADKNVEKTENNLNNSTTENSPTGVVPESRIRRRGSMYRRKHRSVKRKSRSMKRKSRSMKRKSYRKRSMSRRRRY